MTEAWLTGRTAVVTGSGGDMGAGIALRLATAGANIVLNDRVPGRTAAVEEQIRGLGVEVTSVEGSVLRPPVVEELFSAAEERFGGVDVLVNNVGGIKGAIQRTVWEMADDEWDATIAVNLKSLFLCTRRVLPGMIERGSGSIVNLASVAWGGDPVHAAYAASKAGVVSFTRSVATSVGPHGITVNAVAPGLTVTGVMDRMGQVDRRSSARNPLGRLNTPEDIAEAVAYLVSPGARNVSGQLLTVAGGWNPAL